jgi:hypothetical protein
MSCSWVSSLLVQASGVQIPYARSNACQVENAAVCKALYTVYEMSCASHHTMTISRREVEFGLTTLAWAALPIDPGAQHVVSQGMCMLWDREGLLCRLREAVSAS